MDLGYHVGTGIFAAIFVVAVIAQISVKKLKLVSFARCFAYLPFSQAGGALLFRLLSKLYERTRAIGCVEHREAHLSRLVRLLNSAHPMAAFG
jgi:hypothetical protein